MQWAIEVSDLPSFTHNVVQKLQKGTQRSMAGAPATHLDMSEVKLMRKNLHESR